MQPSSGAVERHHDTRFNGRTEPNKLTVRIGLRPRVAKAEAGRTKAQRQKSANRMMMGIGTPTSHSKMERPMMFSLFNER